MKRYKVDSVRLLITGIIFVAAGILLSGLINQVLAVIISTIGSFSIWEASAVWIKTLPNLRAKRLLMKKLAKRYPAGFNSSTAMMLSLSFFPVRKMTGMSAVLSED